MTTPLLVTGQDPVHLGGLLDGTNNLQVQHGSNNLDNHGQSLRAEHEALNTPSGNIKVEIEDFSHGGNNWEVTASHEVGGTTTDWTRDGDHVYRAFGARPDALEIEVVATSDATPAATKRRKIWITTTPVDGQPDRP